MMSKVQTIWLVFLAACSTGPLLANPVVGSEHRAPLVVPTSEALPVGMPIASIPITIPALTPVIVEIMAPLGSKLSKTGEMFPLRLAQPIVVDGKEVVPAGLTGMGEVIHAKKGAGLHLIGPLGTGGEFIAVARYLDFDGQRILLRSLRLSGRGADTDHQVLATATSVFTSSHKEAGDTEVSYPAGTTAQAKVAQPFLIKVRNP